MTIYNLKKEFCVILIMSVILLLSCQKHSDRIQDSKTDKMSDNTITLSEAQIQLANIKVFPVNEGQFYFNRLFSGVLKVDEESATIISARATGRILKLFKRNPGEIVNKGDSIYQIYCEDMVAAERQYFTLQSNNWNFNGKYEPSLALENKLLLFGMLPSQIVKLGKDGKVLFSVTICSPVKGVIRAINITEGQYVNEGQTIFELADDSKLWVEAQVHPVDLDYLKVGMHTKITLPDAGNEFFNSTIKFINPSIEQGKNVTVIRSIIDNSHRKLHPGMLALIHVRSDKSRCVMIPSSSVISDKNGSVVWIQNENGSFSRKTITPGMQSEDSVQILSGLNNSDNIVISGAYLLNSEYILRKGNISEAKL